jgi:transcriptional regulator GlxA family with amidase domain
VDELAIDTIVVPGGPAADEPADLVAWLVRQAPRVRRICAVCTGAFLLAAAGLLAGRRATTHWHAASLLQVRYPEIKVEADPIFINDGDIWTSAGVTAGIDMALALIEEDHGHRLAMTVARNLVMFIKRPGGQSQFSTPLMTQSATDDTFADLHAWMADHLHTDLTVDCLAARARMAPRTFARIYVAKLGRTPAKTVEAMRLEAACRVLEETDHPIKQVAHMCGFGREQNMRRAFLRQFGISPIEYRARFSAHTMTGDDADKERSSLERRSGS